MLKLNPVDNSNYAQSGAACVVLTWAHGQHGCMGLRRSNLNWASGSTLCEFMCVQAHRKILTLIGLIKRNVKAKSMRFARSFDYIRIFHPFLQPHLNVLYHYWNVASAAAAFIARSSAPRLLSASSVQIPLLSVPHRARPITAMLRYIYILVDVIDVSKNPRTVSSVLAVLPMLWRLIDSREVLLVNSHDMIDNSNNPRIMCQLTIDYLSNYEHEYLLDTAEMIEWCNFTCID